MHILAGFVHHTHTKKERKTSRIYFYLTWLILIISEYGFLLARLCALYGRLFIISLNEMMNFYSSVNKSEAAINQIECMQTYRHTYTWRKRAKGFPWFLKRRAAKSTTTLLFGSGNNGWLLTFFIVVYFLARMNRNLVWVFLVDQSW